MTDRWVLSDALKFCRQVEAICPEFGCHVGLTGGLLYKDGERKDIDIIFYKIRQVDSIKRAELMDALATRLGLTHIKSYGWMSKAMFNGKKIDIFFPEHASNERNPDGTYV